MKKNKLPSVIVSTFSILLFSVAQSTIAETASPVRGVVKSSNEAVITVELNARVINTPLQTGEGFMRNDILLEFDCEALRADQKAAQASYNAARSLHVSNLELQKYGAIGEIDVDVSQAQMHEAQAQSEAIKARSKSCVIKAPFNGRIAESAINQYETATPNEPLLKIVGSEELELRLIVPSNWLAWLAVGKEFKFSVDETQIQYEASVIRIGAEVDAVSRTVAIAAKFTTNPDTVLPGMSGTGYFADASN